MRFRPITTRLFTVSGFHKSRASASMRRKLSSLRRYSRSPTWEYLRRLDGHDTCLTAHLSSLQVVDGRDRFNGNCCGRQLPFGAHSGDAMCPNGHRQAHP